MGGAPSPAVPRSRGRWHVGCGFQAGWLTRDWVPRLRLIGVPIDHQNELVQRNDDVRKPDAFRPVVGPDVPEVTDRVRVRGHRAGPGLAPGERLEDILERTS